MEVKYNGKIYKSVNSLSKATGMSRGYLAKCLKKNMSIEEILSNYHSRSFEYNGVTYKSTQEFIKLNNLDEARFNRVYARCNRDIATTMEMYDMPTKKGIRFEYGGLHFESQSEACKTLEIDPHTLMLAKKKFGNIQDAIDYVLAHKRNTHARKVEYNGKVYNNLKELCDDLGLKYNSLISRRYNMQEDDIAKVIEEELAASKRLKVDVLGETYKSQREMCRKLNISYNSYFGHRRKGLSMDEAVAKAKHRIIYDGVEYKSVKELSVATGLSYHALIYQLNEKKETPEAAIAYLRKKAEAVT